MTTMSNMVHVALPANVMIPQPQGIAIAVTAKDFIGAWQRRWSAKLAPENFRNHMYYNGNGDDFNLLAFDIKLGTQVVTVFMPNATCMFTSHPVLMTFSSPDLSKEELNAATNNFLVRVCGEIYNRAASGTYGEVKASTPQQGESFEKTAVYAFLSKMLELDGADTDDDDNDDTRGYQL